uniref:Macrophage mannose receptor 1 n=1 Tax=Lygus hesperus TaxID=30085 RepID=A0A146LFD7_LYGHE
MFATNGGSALPTNNENLDHPKDIPSLNRSFTVGEYSTQPRPVQYEIVMDKMNWYDAVSYCKARRMDLATVRSEAEHQLMIKLMDQSGIPRVHGTGGVYLGGSRLESDHGFYWVTDGLSFSDTYTNWARGQPDNLQGYDRRSL